jgi:hypothetical protein
MQTLFLPDLKLTRDQTDFGLHRDVKKSESSLVGMVLAGRYQVLEAMDASSFKAHDLALDQTVTVREVLPESQCGCDFWREKAYRLASMRDPNFLNILEVISEKGREFVISEHQRGQSIEEFLKKGSPFAPEDVLALMAPLTGALHLAASLGCCPNHISARCLFTETRRSHEDNSLLPSPPQLPSFFLRLDVGEALRSSREIAPPFLAWNARKAGSKRIIVRYVALLTYQLFGGEAGEATTVKHWFKPIRQLGDAGNSVLYRGLRGWPSFRTGEGFFHILSSAIRSGACHSSEYNEHAFHPHQRSLAYPGTNDVLRRFNRDTECLAVGLLGAVLLTALAFAVLLPEHYQKSPDLAKQSEQAKSYSLPKAGAGAPLALVNLNTGESLDQQDPETLARGDPSLIGTASNQNPVQMKDDSKVVPSSMSAPSPELNRALAQRNGSKWSAMRRQDSAATRRIGHKSSARPKFFDVKMQLIALWHRSLLQNEKAPGWSVFRNSNRKKKAVAKEP